MLRTDAQRIKPSATYGTEVLVKTMLWDGKELCQVVLQHPNGAQRTFSTKVTEKIAEEQVAHLAMLRGGNHKYLW